MTAVAAVLTDAGVVVICIVVARIRAGVGGRGGPTPGQTACQIGERFSPIQRWFGVTLRRIVAAAAAAPFAQNVGELRERGASTALRRKRRRRGGR